MNCALFYMPLPHVATWYGAFNHTLHLSGHKFAPPELCTETCACNCHPSLITAKTQPVRAPHGCNEADRHPANHRHIADGLSIWSCIAMGEAPAAQRSGRGHELGPNYDHEPASLPALLLPSSRSLMCSSRSAGKGRTCKATQGIRQNLMVHFRSSAQA